MGQRAYGVDPETEGGPYYNTGSPESGLRQVPHYITVDTSPTGITWMINQEDESGTRFPIRFRAKVLSEGQRGYTQVKRDLWGIISAVKADMADILLRERFDDEDGMVSEDEEVGVDFFKSAYITRERSTPTLNEFREDEYNGEWLQICMFLKTMTPDVVWTKDEATRIRNKVYRYFLWDGNIWRHLRSEMVSHSA